MPTGVILLDKSWLTLTFIKLGVGAIPLPEGVG
jgi:hypothetical protein